MKKYSKFKFSFLQHGCFVLVLLLGISMGNLLAQDSTVAPVVKKVKPVKNTFASAWIIDNQTVMVPVKGTLEFDIIHRFGTLENGAKDFFGFFAPSNIRLGINYAPVSKLFVGIGVTKERYQVDMNAKYALLQQTPGKIPLSISYYTNMVIEAGDKSNYRFFEHRMSFFNQLLIARKITEKLSAQVAPSFTWFNNVEAFVNKNGDIEKKMNNGHFAISVLGRYKISEKSSLIVNYDQPLTQHLTNNPHPNIAFGLETNTSSHAFQVFAGNYYGITQQRNNMYNQNDFTAGQFLIGFNITRLWNY